MARAAVKAKQAQRAQAQVASKPSRKQRKHASGGNPNQDLFFTRLRRKQKWVFVALAIVFAVSFAALGVGSGSGGGLDQLFSGILGGGGDPVAKAQGEIKTDPAKGYKDLADAYSTNGDLPNAITAFQQYLKIKKTDSNAWTQLGFLEQQQANTAEQQYQQVLQASLTGAPGAGLTPKGGFGVKLGTNPITEAEIANFQAQMQPLSTAASAGYSSSLTDFKSAAQYATTNNDRANAELNIYQAARLTGDVTTELAALQKYVVLVPNSPQLSSIEQACKSLHGSCTPPTHKKNTPKHKKK